jgi:hypothetical protein
MINYVGEKSIYENRKREFVITYHKKTVVEELDKRVTNKKRDQANHYQNQNSST